MHFALLGDHADGIALASALSAGGRHVLAAYAGPRAGLEALGTRAAGVTVCADAEDLLANPAVEAVIVAAPLSARAALLRRALQSEHHVLCVHPADTSPDAAYEATMLQRDTGKALVPLLTAALHPALQKLADLTAGAGAADRPRLIALHRASQGAVLLGEPDAGRPCFPDWDVLRRCGGEVAELFALATSESARPQGSALLSGRFDSGGLFQVTLLPNQPDDSARLTVRAAANWADLTLAPGPVVLRLRDASGVEQVAQWEDWDPWPALVARFEDAVARADAGPGTERPSPDVRAWPTWEDEVRALELDDAARRSIEHRRASTLEYPEATEEVGFKGTMTLVGCGLLLVVLAIFLLSAWAPWLQWLVVPLLLAFCALQLLRWLLPEVKNQQRR